ncbi:MAG TPA: CdaR family protein [Bacteroidales bacterium]|nr:CdaR family protein [Bacteroidales bacterium]
MEEEILNRVRRGFSREKLKLNKKLLTFLFFLMLSIIFWLLSALNQNYTTTISYPVHYVNFPKNKVLVGKVPNKLTLNVNAHGYTLLKYKVNFRRIPIIFNVNSFSLYKAPGNETGKFYILTRFAKEKITNQLSSDIQLLDIMPDTLFFEFSSIIDKNVPVVPNVKVSFARQYMVKGEITSDPDSITVSGPHLILDTLSKVYTRFQQLDQINATTQRNLPLKSIDNVSFSQKRVLVTIPVEKFTEASIKVPIVPINLPDTLVMKLFPSEINVSYLVGLSDYDKVQPSSFRATVDYNSIATSINNKLRVSVEMAPPFVRSVKYQPKNVDFVIEKK